MQPGERALFGYVLVGIAVIALIALIRWLFSGSRKADPWDEQINASIDSPESEPTCHRCFHEHSELVHFCPHCGAAVGVCNNLLPFEYLFSEGEVLRNGTTLKTRRSVPVLGGYLLFSLAVYSIFAPVYWFFLFRNVFAPEPAPLVLPPPARD
jgi:hypothetical protein